MKGQMMHKREFENNFSITSEKTRSILISLKKVKKCYQSGSIQTYALRGIDLEVYKGELLVVLGKSGCGKSTLLNIIGGMDSLTEGEFRFEDTDFSKSDEKTLTEYRRNSVGFVFQSYNLMPELTAKENLDFIAALCKEHMNSDELLDIVGLGDCKNKYPSQLSGGQQQRVSIARALVKMPQIILADEPTAALDYTTSIEVLKVMEDIVAKGTTMVMVTHNEEIAKIANRIIRMKDGLLIDVIENDRPYNASQLEW